MYASGGKKCSFFGKFGVFSFLVTPVLRFALLPYYQRINIFRLSQVSKMELLTNIGNSFCLIRFWIDLWRLHLFSVILRKIGRIWLQRALNLLYNLSIIFSYWFSKFDNLDYHCKKYLTSPNFLVWKFWERAQFPHSFGRNDGEIVPFHKISTPEN